MLNPVMEREYNFAHISQRVRNRTRRAVGEYGECYDAAASLPLLVRVQVPSFEIEGRPILEAAPEGQEAHMRIGLISDTRVLRAEKLPREILQAFEGVELILHAGGIQTSPVLDWLERIAPVKAAGRLHGRHTESRQPLSIEGEGDTRVAEQQTLKLEGQTIGLVNELWFPPLHDEIMPGVIEAHHFPDGTLPTLLGEYFGVAVDIVVFGRTLYALIEEHQGILFINPGSPTLPKNQMKLGNVAILNLTADSRDATIIDLGTI